MYAYAYILIDIQYMRLSGAISGANQEKIYKRPFFFYQLITISAVFIFGYKMFLFSNVCECMDSLQILQQCAFVKNLCFITIF